MARQRDRSTGGGPAKGARGPGGKGARTADAARAGTTARGRQGYVVGAGPTRRGRGPDRRVPMVIGAVVALLVLASAGAWLFVFRDSASAFESAMTAGGCVERTFPNAGTGVHLSEEQAPPKYPSDPPTQGPHRQGAALWGIYDEPIEQALLVHNLEHGGLVVQYGDQVPADQVARIREDVLDDRDLTVVAPYPKLGDKLAYTMWTRLVTCDRFEPGVLGELQTRRNQAPAPEVPQDPTFGRRPGY